jgi:hypothetical protein
MFIDNCLEDVLITAPRPSVPGMVTRAMARQDIHAEESERERILERIQTILKESVDGHQHLRALLEETVEAVKAGR